jgi:predicted PurR-regulated permease PerM
MEKIPGKNTVASGEHAGESVSNPKVPSTVDQNNGSGISAAPAALTGPRHRGGGKHGITINRFAVLGLLALVTIAIFPIIRMFFVPIIVAAAFATLFHPLYTWLLKKFRNNRAVASFACCLVLFLGLVTPTYLVVNLVAREAVDLYQTAQPAIRDVVEKGGNSDVVIRLQQFPLVKWFRLSNINPTVPLHDGAKALATAGTKLFNRTSAGLMEFFVTIFIMFFTMFYFFMDGDELVKRIKYLVPINEDYKKLIITRFLLISRATVMGTVVIGVTQGTLGALLLLFCGIKSWLMWGFIMVILATIPLLGAWVVLIPTGIIQIILGNTATGIVILAVSMLGISSIDNVIRPRIVGQGAKLHDLVIFFSSLGGIATFGVMGFIVGPVIAALFVAVLDIYGKEFEAQLGAENAGE